MHAHTTRSVSGRRMATALLLPAVGLGLLSACSSEAPVESSESPEITEEVIEKVDAQDTLDPTCDGVEEVLGQSASLGMELSALIDELVTGDEVEDEADLEEALAEMQAVASVMSEYGESMQHLSGDLSGLADEAEDPQLADAITETEGGFESIANMALSFADIDLTGIYGYLDAIDGLLDFDSGMMEVMTDEDLLEADEYIGTTCDIWP